MIPNMNLAELEPDLGYESGNESELEIDDDPQDHADIIFKTKTKADEDIKNG